MSNSNVNALDDGVYTIRAPGMTREQLMDALQLGLDAQAGIVPPAPDLSSANDASTLMAESRALSDRIRAHLPTMGIAEAGYLYQTHRDAMEAANAHERALRAAGAHEPDEPGPDSETPEAAS